MDFKSELTIIADGYKDGKQLKVEIEEKAANEIYVYLFNGESDLNMQLEVENSLGKVAIGGTYYPKTMPLQLLAVLEGRFFDRSPEIQVIGKIKEKIPQPGGKNAIY